jgi:membrane protein required for colicin V production
MNWLDYIILAVLVTGIVMGFKRGFVREAMGLLGIIFGVIIAINYVDWASGKFLSHMHVSPHVVTFFCFILLFLTAYLAFKLLGMVFYRIGQLSPLGRLDKIGGGFFGFVQAWILTGMILLLLMFFPLPQSFLRTTDTSFFAPVMRGTIPMIYEESSALHPGSGSFVQKIADSFRVNRSARQRYDFNRFGGSETVDMSKTERVLAEIRKRFVRSENIQSES